MPIIDRRRSSVGSVQPVQVLMASDVTVVMATYNRTALLARARAGFDRQTGCRVEVVVVDDDSTGDTAPSDLGPAHPVDRPTS